MNSVKIVHTADLHLINPASVSDTLRKQLALDALSVFYSIIDFCKEYRPDVLLISGDLFSTPDTNESFARQVFEKFYEIPFSKVIITPGNHDFLSASSPYNFLKTSDNVHVFSDFSQIEIAEKNTVIYGAGFSSRFVKQSIFFPADDTDKINICAIHGDITNSFSEYNPISLSDIEKRGYDYIALGHIHSFSGIKNIGNTYYSYPGTPQGQGFDEKNEKGIVWGTISKSSKELNFKKMSKRMFVEFSFDITNCTLPSQAVSEIQNYIKETFGDDYNKNLYRINLTGEYKNNYGSYIEYISENLKNTLFYCEINDCTKSDINLLKSMIDETTIKGIYIKKMLKILEESNDEAYKTAKKALYIGLEVLGNDN